jgi:hypothetical protein
MPFARAAEMLEALTGVQVSEATARRHTYCLGMAYQDVQTAQARQPELCETKSNAMAISPDGAMVSLVGGQWAEVKTLAIGQVQPSEGEEVGHSSNLSYFSRMTDAQTFADLATVETARRGIAQAERVCAVMDGAEWLDGFVDLHRPDAVRILDFSHAASYVSKIGPLAGLVEPDFSSWLRMQLHSLKHDGPTAVLQSLRDLRQQHASSEEMAKALAYLEKREGRMQYPQYQAQGWPIGSGIVESGNKVVMQARLKGAGMHWAPAHVNPMLALRTAACNDRWKEALLQATARLSRQRKSLRVTQAKRRAHQPICQCLQHLISLCSQTPSQAPPPASAPLSSSGGIKLSPKYSWRQPFLKRNTLAKN